MEVPVCEKVLLTVEEASAYTNIGRDRLYALAKSPKCTFVLFNGRNILIKRKQLERFLEQCKEL